MITHRYGPYESADSDPQGWSVDRLMSILSDLIMKYDLALEEALNELIQRGLPVNLFLKEGGIEDLVQTFLDEIQNRINEILTQFRLNRALTDTQTDITTDGKKLQELTKSHPEIKNQIADAIKNRSFDQAQQIRHSFVKLKTVSAAHLRSLQLFQKSIEDYNRIDTANKKFTFTGKEDVDRATALKIIKTLEELEDLRQNLNTARQHGDLFGFNLDQLAGLLGPEAYDQFVEQRKRILDKMTQLLEGQGQIIQDESGELKLSPAAIRRIGRRALEEIFSNLKSDDSGGTLISNEESESEQTLSISRPYELGDSVTNLDSVNSIINALVRTGQPKPTLRDLEVYRSRGQAKTATAVLIDMSGSMLRSDRFASAKRMILALDSLIRQDYKEDDLIIVGFGTFAKVFSPAEIPTLQPYPVTIYDPYIRLKFDLARRSLNSKLNDSRQGIPEYFTNLQAGLSLCRKLLAGKSTNNKQILLITDGVPTAHFEQNILHIHFPPSPSNFTAALKETEACASANITINTFLLTSEWGFTFFDEKPFVEEFAKRAGGRIFYPHPSKLDQFVLVDFIAGKKRLIS